MNKKILFFDIDGTLLPNMPHEVPKSAVKALRCAQENGHLLFVNSGRTWAMIPEQLKKLSFDGYVCGCGSEVYLHGEKLFSQSVPNHICRATVQALRDFRIGAVFECPHRYLYDSAATQPSAVIPNMQGRYPLADLTEFSPEETSTYTFSKAFLTLSSNSDREAFRSFCQDKYDIFVHEENVWEIGQKSCSKATGMEVLLNRLQIARKDSFAFGDSENDLPMLRYAGISVAMGNANPKILPFCTWQTTDILADGIAHALEHFGLV